ncbi:glycine cleavage system T protein [Violaceomyces palustris]|uniref:Glycine cleavage system T protein n=1 Tax=Violaceomyces palustris TaxID=1673888 RepID=A0ACD0P2L0_9BASI|nr:glycine cleavage system T protein [Violaceomyces palustris]
MAGHTLLISRGLQASIRTASAASSNSSSRGLSTSCIKLVQSSLPATPSFSRSSPSLKEAFLVRSIQSGVIRRSIHTSPITRSDPPAASSLSKTGLYEFHIKNGAKMVPFSGYSMPLTYADVGQMASHHHVRSKTGLFDVGHMVQHNFTGPTAQAFLERISPSSVSSLAPFSSTLSVLLSESGGILDDLIITKHSDEKFYLVTNAGRREEDLAWIRDRLKEWNASHEPVHHEVLEGWGLLALQGPTSSEVLQKLVGEGFDLKTLTFGKSAFIDLKVAGGEKVKCHVARAGYTGEDGFEISIPPTSTVSVAEALVSDPEVQLAGLAARDSLRLEAGMCLYGQDLDETVSPIEAGLAWCVGKDRRKAANFIGHQRVLSELEKGPSRRRVGLVIQGSPARQGCDIFNSDGKKIGKVTSGIPSPTLGKNIAMALVEDGHHKRGTKVLVEVRKKLREAEVAKMPFVENKFYRG